MKLGSDHKVEDLQAFSRATLGSGRMPDSMTSVGEGLIRMAVQPTTGEGDRSLQQDIAALGMDMLRIATAARVMEEIVKARRSVSDDNDYRAKYAAVMGALTQLAENQKGKFIAMMVPMDTLTDAYNEQFPDQAIDLLVEEGKKVDEAISAWKKSQQG